MNIDLRKPNLRECPIGTIVITSSSHQWELLERKDGKETWKDLAGLVWSDKEGGMYSHDSAMKKFGDRIPSKEMWKEAENHGVREVLPNMNYWFTTSSVHPVYSNFAYFFNGRSGVIRFYVRGFAGGVAVRCVARR